MELVTEYNRIHKFTNRLHHITMYSVLNRIMESYKNAINNEETREQIKDLLESEMRTRRLDKYFQVMLSGDNTIDINVIEINPYDRQEECVIWN